MRRVAKTADSPRMAGSLHDIVAWVRSNGAPGAVDRLRLRILPLTMRERLWWDDITPETVCSAQTLLEVKREASAIVGKPCPL